MLGAVKRVVEIKQKEEEQRSDDKGVSFTFSTMRDILDELNNQVNTFAREQTKYLDEYKPEVNKHAMLLPIKNFAVKFLKN